MLQDTFILIATGLLLMLPVVFWMYIFVAFFPYGVSRKQFFMGIFAGGCATLPFIYTQQLFLGEYLRSIFFYLSLQIWEMVFLSLVVFMGILWGIIFVLGGVFQEKKKHYLKIHSLSIIGFSFLLILGISLMGPLHEYLSESVSGISIGFREMVFSSIGAIISYYIVISFLEEGVKYISSISFGGRSDSTGVFQRYICMSACIALGFAFYENILYTWNYIGNEGITSGVISLVFFRSIFTIILHLVSSMLLAMGFYYLFSLKKEAVRKIISFVLIASIAIMSHTFFDVVLTFGYIGYIFFYIVGIYLFLGYLATTTSH